MHVLRSSDFPTRQHHVGVHRCPYCNSPVDRVRRRFIDRLVSLITPVRRYRCRGHGWDCTWEGRLP